MEEDEIAEVIRKHGWYAAAANDGDPSFVYTVGLMQTWNHPELILFGLQSKTAHGVLSGMVAMIGTGGSFREPGSYSGVLQREYEVGVRRVDPTQHQVYLRYAMGYLRFVGHMGELEAVQVFWPDKAHKFPFDPGCRPEVCRRQPRLDLALTPSEVAEFERKWRGA